MMLADKILFCASSVEGELQDALRRIAVDARKMERTLDEIVADAMEDALLPPSRAQVLPFARREIEPSAPLSERSWP